MSSWEWGSGLLALQVLIAGIYLWQMLLYRRAWCNAQPCSQGERVPDGPNDLSSTDSFVHNTAGAGERPAPAFSILIAARNEAENLPLLLADLQQQLPVPGGFEVLVADDHSTDATAAVVLEAAQRLPFSVRLLQLANLPGARTGKKAAVEAAVRAAQAPWVLLTDADCRVPAGWLQAYATLAADPAVQFISGPVLLTGTGWLAALQGLELAGLVGVGAASINRQQPTMCNGANLAYRRAAFAAVDGFRGNEAVPSGDDEFLLHKMHAAYPGGVRFLQNRQAIVRTAAQPTLRQLLWQRVRWASKWRHYQAAAPQRLAVLVLLANLTFPIGLGLWLGGASAGWLAPLAWGLKLAGDVVFLRPVLQFLGRAHWLRWVPVLQLAYAPYALATGLLGLRGGYVWKGRQTQT
ncbi:glycosyltransferase [Hymenobacter taeanensis]|uniref:Glycosyltransferase n=1 Tax=Hymenobacter taeanensis TaxID=2735321 RepID=A0A6M6BJM7_9BACT|nr:MULTISPECIES: glycosyltransferase [Hymenobacter]QJX48068.1 glycosyltransferase [Hymenobacter taeanensis]UOQ82477.1 glycosyltransferase [Hymenobacter sp. 5414T-23]